MNMDKDYELTDDDCSSLNPAEGKTEANKTNNGYEDTGKHTEEVSVNQAQIDGYDGVQKMLESKFGVPDTPSIDFSNIWGMSSALSSVKGIKRQMEFMVAVNMIAVGQSEQPTKDMNLLEYIHKKKKPYSE